MGAPDGVDVYFLLKNVDVPASYVIAYQRVMTKQNGSPQDPSPRPQGFADLWNLTCDLIKGLDWYEILMCVIFLVWLKTSGQIIATSHDRFPPNAGLVREIPLFQGNLGWWNIIIWPETLVLGDGPLLGWTEGSDEQTGGIDQSPSNDREWAIWSYPQVPISTFKCFKRNASLPFSSKWPFEGFKWPFQELSDLHLGDQEVTWKKLV